MANKEGASMLKYLIEMALFEASDVISGVRPAEPHLTPRGPPTKGLSRFEGHSEIALPLLAATPATEERGKLTRGA